jgi:hypothetical protein
VEVNECLFVVDTQVHSGIEGVDLKQEEHAAKIGKILVPAVA